MGLRSCGTWTLLPRSMWNLPGPGIEPMQPAWAAGFLITRPSEKLLFPVYINVNKAAISILVCPFLTLFSIIPSGLIPLIGMTGSKGMSILSLLIPVAKWFSKNSFQSVFQLAAFHCKLSKSECCNLKFDST